MDGTALVKSLGASLNASLGASLGTSLFIIDGTSENKMDGGDEAAASPAAFSPLSFFAFAAVGALVAMGAADGASDLATISLATGNNLLIKLPSRDSTDLLNKAKKTIRMR